MTNSPWWLSAQVFGAMWAVIVTLSGVVIYFFRSWQADRQQISNLKGEIDAIKIMLKGLDNGTSLAVVVSKVTDIHEWWMAKIKG